MNIIKDYKKKIFIVLQIISYILVFIGGYIGIKEINKEDEDEKEKVDRGTRSFIQIGLIPLLIISTIWHTLLSGSIFDRDCQFFEFEAAGANVGVLIALIVALAKGSDIECLTHILLVFAVYLTVALICHIYFLEGFFRKFNIAPFLGLLCYFIYKSYD